MNIRTPNEIKTLDDEINLFEEENWNFLEVVKDSSQNNFEYFNDIRDTDFSKHSAKSVLTKVVVLLIFVLFITVFALLGTIFLGLNKTDIDIENLNNLGSSTTTKLVHKTGDDVDNEDFLAIQELISKYMRVVSSKGSYESLNTMCKTSSNFADTYYSNTAKIKVTYDKNDCYARALREFGGLCKINKVTDVVKKDDIYYCYVTISVPTDANAKDFVYRNQYNIIKSFVGVKPTETELYKGLFNILDTSIFPTTSNEFEVKMVKKGSKFKIVEDTFITSICVDSHSRTVYEMSRVVGKGTTIGR